MTDEQEKKLDELMQMAQMGSVPSTMTVGYGLYPIGDQSNSVPTTIPEVPTPMVTK